MTTPGQVAIVLGMLTLIAGGSLIGWIRLFYMADRAERGDSEEQTAEQS